MPCRLFYFRLGCYLIRTHAERPMTEVSLRIDVAQRDQRIECPLTGHHVARALLLLEVNKPTCVSPASDGDFEPTGEKSAYQGEGHLRQAEYYHKNER
jgi:hypothetical protein